MKVLNDPADRSYGGVSGSTAVMELRLRMTTGVERSLYMGSDDTNLEGGRKPYPPPTTSMFSFLDLSTVGGDWFLWRDIVLADVGAGGGGEFDPVHKSSTLEHRPKLRGGGGGGGSVGGGGGKPVVKPTDCIWRGCIAGGGIGTQSSEPDDPDLECVPEEEDVEAWECIPESHRLSGGVTEVTGEGEQSAKSGETSWTQA